MNEVLFRIKTGVGAESIGESCKESGCRASMAGIPRERVIVDCNRAFENHGVPGKRCDCLLFFWHPQIHRLMVVSIELKGRSFAAGSVRDQLQAGLRFAFRFVPGTARSGAVPILTRKRRMNRHEFRALNRSKVMLHGRELTITAAKCNQEKNLINALEVC